MQNVEAVSSYEGGILVVFLSGILCAAITVVYLTTFGDSLGWNILNVANSAVAGFAGHRLLSLSPYRRHADPGCSFAKGLFMTAEYGLFSLMIILADYFVGTIDKLS